jgi:Zn-dependent protease/predicted transcriptional regulator
MFGRTIKLFRLFGFEVRVNVSWAFLALLIAVSLARGYFPVAYEGWPAVTYWWMAAAGVIGVFFSIVFHELSHSLAARAMGMEMKGITLFLFGGVAEMEREPTSPKGELVTAIAGPLFSLALAALLLGIYQMLPQAEEPTPAGAVIRYLGWLNLVLAIFNLIPAFPMDGGRVLRAALWSLRGDLRWATRWASRMGAAFGLALIFLGILVALTGGLVAGIWWFLIGMFIRAAAIQSYQQQEVTRLLSGVKAADVMERDPHSVPRSMTVRDLVEHYIYEFQQTEIPVSDNGEMAGTVGLAQIKAVPKADWERTRVGDIMIPVEQAALIAPGDDVVEAVRRLQKSGADALIVADGRKPLGVLSRSDVMKLLDLKMDLESE